MKQLVVLVAPNTVTYYLDTGDHAVEELATVSNRFNNDIQQVVSFGANLADALGVNGSSSAPPAPPKAVTAPSAPAKPRPPAKPAPFRASFTTDQVLKDIRKHPGTTAREGAARLCGDERGMGLYKDRAKALEKQQLIASGVSSVSNGMRGRNPAIFRAIDLTAVAAT